MHNNEFERKVQRQMEELRLPPSDDVWLQVQAGIRKEKRRRMWRFVPAALLLLVPGYLLFVLNSNPSKQVVSGQLNIEQKNPHPSNQTTTNTAKKADDLKLYTDSIKQLEEIKNNNEEHGLSIVDPKASAVSEAHNDNGAGVKDFDKSAKRIVANSEGNRAATNSAVVLKRGSNNNTFSGNNNKFAKGKAAKHQPGAGESVADSRLHDNSKNKTGGSGNDLVLTDISISKNVSTAAVEEDLRRAIVSNVKVNNRVGEIKAPAIKIENSTTQKVKKMSRWQWGVQATPGLSNVTKAYTNTPNVSYLSNASGPYLNSRSNSSTVPNPQPNNGAAFSVGLFAKKAIKKLHLEVGLNYSYYSSTVLVGPKVDSNAIVRLQDMSLVSASTFYQDGDGSAYHNKYHFIEIPVSVGMELFKIGDAKVKGSIGASYAYMVSGKMLFHNNYNTHFENNSLLNRSQIFLNAGIGVLLNEDASIPVTVGPVVSYGATRLAKPATSTGQHIVSVGLKASFSLQKVIR